MAAGNLEDAINSRTIPPGSRIYCAGNASTPQVLLKQIVKDKAISGADFYGVCFLGEDELLDSFFSEEMAERITFRIIFNSAATRKLVNTGRAKYHIWHLSEIPRQLREHVRPNVVLLQVSGPDAGGNYSLGTTVEAVFAAIQSAKANGGTVIAERNAKMPFVLGTTVPAAMIDHVIDVDYELPLTPVTPADEKAEKIGRIIANLFIEDGCTIQFGIGGVPEAVADAAIEKGVKDLGIYTELFADAMRRLVQKGIVTNKKNNRKGDTFSRSSIFLASSQEGYDWLHFNSCLQSRAINLTNSILTIAKQPKMRAINSAIGVDLHGNIWADSFKSSFIYSGIGGQSDFIRGAQYSEGGKAIIALKSVTGKGMSKILENCPEGITTTGISADQVILVTENGALCPFGLSLGEKAVGIAYLAAPDMREQLLAKLYENPAFHDPRGAVKNGRPKGFIPYQQAV